jgi:hypothetical protein
MNLSVLAALMITLGASSSARTRDLQVEAVAAAGSELPELREAVSRALLVGGARVVMRGPIAGACENCTRIKVTELSPGIFRIEVVDQDNTTSTTLDLSSGTRLLDRARAIAIHARLLVGRSSGSNGPAQAQARPPRTPKAKPALSASAPVTTSPPGPEPLARPTEAWSGRDVASSAPNTPSPPLPSAKPEPVPARPAHDDSKTPSLIAEARRPVPSEAKVVETKKLPAGQRETEATPSPAAIETARADVAVSKTTSRPKWPWIPSAVAAGAGLAAGFCALMARNRYDGLSDKTQSLDSARSLKSSGKDWQMAGYVLAGVAAAGLAAGIVGFTLPASGGRTANATLAPIPGGGMAMMTWGVP